MFAIAQKRGCSLSCQRRGHVVVMDTPVLRMDEGKRPSARVQLEWWQVFAVSKRRGLIVALIVPMIGSRRVRFVGADLSHPRRDPYSGIRLRVATGYAGLPYRKIGETATRRLNYLVGFYLCEAVDRRVDRYDPTFLYLFAIPRPVLTYMRYQTPFKYIPFLSLPCPVQIFRRSTIVPINLFLAPKYYPLFPLI